MSPRLHHSARGFGAVRSGPRLGPWRTLPGAEGPNASPFGELAEVPSGVAPAMPGPPEICRFLGCFLRAAGALHGPSFALAFLATLSPNKPPVHSVCSRGKTFGACASLWQKRRLPLQQQKEKYYVGNRYYRCHLCRRSRTPGKGCFHILPEGVIAATAEGCATKAPQIKPPPQKSHRRAPAAVPCHV